MKKVAVTITAEIDVAAYRETYGEGDAKEAAEYFRDTATEAVRQAAARLEWIDVESVERR